MTEQSMAEEASSQSISLADRIADAVLSEFESLPAKYRPNKDSNGVSNWVPLSGIVLEYQDNSLECASLATGMKCLPASKVALAQGQVLHDSHAEILALRSFNHFLLQECARLLETKESTSRVILLSDGCNLPFRIRDDIKIHMYCSEAPCGDSSMELIMQKQEDATPWTNPIPTEGLLGRGNFSELGVVRRKPSRADSPMSFSKSCSDKLAMKQCLSVLSSHTSCFIMPESAYLSSIVIPKSQYVASAITRCFGPDGRMKDIDHSSWPTGYTFRPFQVWTTSREFSFSVRSGELQHSNPKPSNLAVVWNSFGQEIIINGIVQGRKQTDPKRASMLSRLRLGAQAQSMLEDDLYKDISTYEQRKASHPQLKRRATVKDQVTEKALSNWVRNVPDDCELRSLK